MKDELTPLGHLPDNIKYDETAKPIKTYCPECGAEDGEIQPHAKDCPCVWCAFDRHLLNRMRHRGGGKSITFRRITGIRSSSE